MNSDWDSKKTKSYKNLLRVMVTNVLYEEDEEEEIEEDDQEVKELKMYPENDHVKYPTAISFHPNNNNNKDDSFVIA